MEDRPDYAKEHKSHYRCIKTWVVDAVNERKPKRDGPIVYYDASKNEPVTEEQLKAIEEFRNGKIN